MHRTRLLTVAAVSAAITMAALLAAAPAIAGAPGKVVDSRIEKVTVYSTAAQITRTAVIDLEPGTHVLIFDKLPLRTYQDALGCHVDGQARVLSLKLDTRTYDKPVEERLRALEQEVLELKRQIEDLDAVLRALDQKQEFLTGIRVETPKAIAQAATATSSYPLGGLRAALAFVEDEWTDLEERRLAIGRRKSELDARRARLEAEQSALKAPAAGIETRLEAQVEIAVRSAGKVRIELTYLVAGASWRPYYDARLDRLAGKVEWSSYAEIRQRSGEDWEDIELSVATADPLRATKPPVLDPIFLGAGSAPPEPPEKATALARTQQRGVEALQESKELRQLPVDDVSEAISLKAGVVSQGGGLHFRGGRSGEVAVHVEGGKMDNYISGGYEAEYGNALSGTIDLSAPTPVFSLAQLGETPTSSIYRIERSESIPSDDSWHRATIAVHDFPAELEILTVPRKARLAYLHARSINETGAPLMPGPVHLFTGSDFMGTAALDRAVAPGRPSN